jgi:hypothetical protein
MKIAHLTLLHGYNYGGMLQAYATQSILKSHGHSVVTLDYHPWKKHDLIRRASLNFRPIFDKVRKYMDKRAFSGVDAFDQFRKKNFEFSKPCQTPAQLSRECGKMDFVAVGSDQIWSSSWTRPPYFADFELPSTCKRVSLSAGCGAPSNDPAFRDFLSNTITKFDSISVRNDFTARMVEESTGRRPDVLCDPTLACSIPVEPISGINEKFALIYVINRPQSLQLAGKVIERLRAETGMHIISVPPTELRGKESLSCDRIESEISPFQWAWLVQKSSMVVTDSFHGTVFSAKYHKPIAILDSGFRANNRLHAISSDLGLESAILSSNSAIDVSSFMTSGVDWSRIDSKISESASKYHAFVTKHINGISS